MIFLKTVYVVVYVVCNRCALVSVVYPHRSWEVNMLEGVFWVAINKLALSIETFIGKHMILSKNKILCRW